jgi:hypothetical protein
MNYVLDALFVAGLALLGTGAYFYDWRLACVVVGGTLVAVTTAAMARGDR